ncbi:ribosome hibernation-promoting factor, HPF/YfiA family [Acidihalobacter ferrooxydans]|uniref:Ribosome hibernation promoting factor n=1 Tax=Acidihalobacter ferrooxydans TaxID=1765967 RepID=A0A1P8UJB2_9GAMM|nr:ribosome-associated translation inhibitor RaiA [Acidihalobacter ferrooxydans]APZ43936.1 ribosomal subunit interface protein [Acidihalobacter ferrooxydans]
MQINLTGHHLELTDALRSYVEEKFRKLERHFDNVIDVHVVLSVEKLRQKAEASLLLGGSRIHAVAETEDMYAAIDSLIDKLDRQVVKHKEKTKDHHKADADKRLA